MKKLIVTALLALSLALGIGATVVLTEADAAPATTVKIVGKADGSQILQVNGVPMSVDHYAGSHTPWISGSNGGPKRFNSQYICAQNNIGTLWNISGATNAFESGINTYVINYRFPAWGDQPCSVGYVDSQQIQYGTFNEASSTCYEVYTSSVNGRYNEHVTVALNASSQSYSACRSTAQKLNNNVSQATGNALGLANFTSSTSWSASIMNGYYENVYNFAGGDDRTSLCKLLGICS